MQNKFLIFSLAVIIAVGIAGFFLASPPVSALEPEWGKLTFDSAYAVQSTADQTLLAAPGTNYSWVVTSVWFCVTTTEANANVQIEDAAGTPVVAVSIPLDAALAGMSDMIYFGDGVICSTNSAVQVDFSGSTGEASFVINAYKVYNP